MTARPVALVGIAAMLLIACTSQAEAPLGWAFPRHDGSFGPEALQVGRLQAVGPCLYLRDDADGISRLVIWPPEATLEDVDVGVAAVTMGGRRSQVGDQVRLVGGSLSDPARLAPVLRDAILPPACVTPEVVITTGYADPA